MSTLTHSSEAVSDKRSEERAPRASDTRSIPSLDGLRAVSISLVLLSHAAISSGANVNASVHQYVDWGAVGVRVFFVISGYLITKLLLQEQARTGRIALGHFYFRRTLRIFPPFYTYLLAVAALAGAGVLSQSIGGVIAAATYTANYATDVGWYVGHSWSLAVEEQFYLLWPAAMILLGRHARWAAWAMLALCPLARWWAYSRLDGAYGFDHRFETTADFLAMGCLLAIYEGSWRHFVSKFRRAPTLAFFGCVLIAVLASSFGGHPRVDLLFSRTASAGAIAGMLLFAVHAPGSAAGMVLNWAPLAWVGRISYSLYLWQQLLFGPGVHTGIFGVSWRVAVALALAVLSYVVIEQPIARRRGQVAKAIRMLLSRQKRVLKGA